MSRFREPHSIVIIGLGFSEEVKKKKGGLREVKSGDENS